MAVAAQSLRGAPLRPEVTIEEVPAPARLAPAALGLAAEVGDADGVELAAGRFLVLHDPDEPAPWGSAWRVVTYARARMDPRVADDPSLAATGWSWLQQALEQHAARHTALAGAVTRVVDERFGDIADEPATVDLEIRASWSPIASPERLADHLVAFGDVLCELAGLQSLPEGVVALPRSWRTAGG